ncbi:TonB-dependent receptor domain-containing protein [Novosphingobium album (ex Liu et al. 2023)]|uniref:TonB-dependent receptor n=1 Tax=Novosphingobium album (ex Liu et al. 2023) TaxID=3031130 RepID=A0ABT5WMU8_9SPHN|nr:TonB-dependent receptor [Novosphingobium album (ex Liu et al. 2023)]MDE8651209.1 TonB-dependent receptor [Novosphingobium album (ex Liu et al. 2023)]
MALALAIQFAVIAPAHAQEAPAPAEESVAADGAAEPAGEITVTGSRIVRNGYDTPTPITVVSTQDLQASAPANVADYVNQLPAISGSSTPANNQRGLTSGAAGLNTVSMRNLGSGRTLVLIDGHRTVASTMDGAVDTNLVPQGLIKSIEIVTGGASSVYGSDAVAGVVNYILDRDYTGIKGDLSYGETTYGDDNTYRATLTAGMKFGGGRGHFLLNGTIIQRDGINGVPREWADKGRYLTQNPAYVPGNGQPQYMPANYAGLNVVTGGGIIVNGPARGVYFGEGGTLNHYDYGDNYNPAGNGEWTIGGDWKVNQHIDGTSLQPAERMRGIYGRLSYDIFDNVNVYGEFSYNRSYGLNWGGRQTDRGNIPIACDNAFIPTALLAQYPSLACGTRAPGTTSFSMGSYNADYPTRESDNLRQVYRYVVGAEGNFNLLKTNWKWDAYYQKGIAKNRISLISANRVKLSYAQDAVWNDDHSQIVCRVTRNGSTDPLADGCVPYNRFGIGVNSQDALDYVMGNPWTKQRLQQDVGAINFSTEIDNPWLKPIGLAFGFEHRREAVSGYTPEFAKSGWYSGNFADTVGHYNVNEGYVETLVSLPLNVEFNGAARLTSYQLAGEVVTWKTGFTWSPISDLRVRVVRSKDIRAPNLSELFVAGGGNTNALLNPWSGANARYRGVPQGNLNLKPEKADTWSLGVVYRPSFVPGFGLSVDFYDIKIKGAIDSLSAQQIVDRCFEGNEDLCQQIALSMPDNLAAPRYAYGDGWNRTTGPVPGFADFWVYTVQYNYVGLRAKGLDFEVSYQTPLDRISENLPGTLSIRGLANRAIDRITDNGTQAPTDIVGQNTGSLPTWKYRVTANYVVDDFTMQLTGRGFSGGVFNNNYVECTSGCPASTSINRTISDNHLPGAFYVDAYLSHKFGLGGVNGDLYLQINNLFNKDPALVGAGPSDTSSPDPGTNRSLYDYLGRTFRIGLRFDLGG